MKLNVNIDHLATLRQARGGVEPDPVAGAIMAELAGASGIVVHLREDRRHAQDRDVYILRDVIQTKLDLEMAASDDIIEVALKIVPDLVTLVPEKREELTTEGGLDVANNFEKYAKLTERMHEKFIDVSYFIEPDEKQIEAAKNVGADMVEFHTGTYANAADRDEINHELNRIEKAIYLADSMGLQIAVGHGLNYLNVQALCRFTQIQEFSIGHSIIARAALIGIDRAVREMLDLIKYHYSINLNGK